MSILHDQAIAKIRQMPESLVQEVNAFIDSLMVKHSHQSEQPWQSLTELAEADGVETDMADYLSNLEDYEERLARGEVQW